MKQILVIIERAKDGTYSAYGEDAIGLYGMGDSAAEAKASALKSLELFLKKNKAENIPAYYSKPYQIIYKFDAQSLLNYYKGVFSNAALERITGINQRQLNHYSSGLKKPRPAQTQKIQKALHELGTELLAVEL